MDITTLSKKGLTASELSEKLAKRNLSICFFCSDIQPIKDLKEVPVKNMIVKCCEKCYKKRFKRSYNS